MSRPYRLSPAARDALRARTKALNQDPAFKAAASARMKALNQDPVVVARRIEALRQAKAKLAVVKNLPKPARALYAKLRAYGIDKAAALAEVQP